MHLGMADVDLDTFNSSPSGTVQSPGAPSSLDEELEAAYNGFAKGSDTDDDDLSTYSPSFDADIVPVPAHTPSAFSLDGTLTATASTRGPVMLWDTADGNFLWYLDAGSTISMLSFSPMKYWLSAATSDAVKVWDLEP